MRNWRPATKTHRRSAENDHVDYQPWGILPLRVFLKIKDIDEPIPGTTAESVRQQPQTSETIDKNRAIGRAHSRTSARVSDQRLAEALGAAVFMSVLLTEICFPDETKSRSRRNQATVVIPTRRGRVDHRDKIWKCTRRANRAGAFAITPRRGARSRLQAAEKCCFRRSIFFRGRPELTARKKRRGANRTSATGRLRPALERFAPAPATETGAIRPSRP